jgi:phage repressor protein C with HTH and peptisase S24 domain
LSLRRLASGEILIMSDNGAYEPELLRGAELKRFKIVGRVIWWDNRL